MTRSERPSTIVNPSIDRRLLLRVGMFGLAAAPAQVLAVTFDTGRGFTHGVASGEPSSASVLLWTRFRGEDAPVALRYEVAEDKDFMRVVAGGDTLASPARDWCAKPVANGLAPGRWYYYRFVAPDGSMSAVGRTRTLPDGPTGSWRMAVFSCSNLGFGWFNAYAHAADADDFDMALHLGDYFYEYKLGTYPSARQFQPGRVLRPEHEIVALADYRLRYAAYRADPDLQRIHQLFPFVTVPDDHETANDSWKGGAENHQPETEGDWELRKRAAMQANREWLPVSDEMWASYDIGDLATIFRLETRLVARDRPFDLTSLIKGFEGEAREAALMAFRDESWRDPARTLLGGEQERWLASGLAGSVAAGRHWQVLAQQVVMASLSVPPLYFERMPADVPDYIRLRVERAAAASEIGLPANMDAWDGYPAARERLLDAARAADANLVVLAGDSHNAWASDLAGAGVEFAGHSVTSPGAESSIGWIEPDDVARSLVERNPQLQWADTQHRGYMAVELTPARASSEYRFLETVRARSTALAGVKRITSAAGSNTLQV